MAEVGIRVTISGVDKASQGFDQLRNKASSTANEVEKLAKNGQSSMLGFGNAVKTAIAAFAGSQAISGLAQTALSMDRINKTLKVATGSAADAAKEFAYVKSISNTLGLELLSTANQFGSLAAAAKGTRLEGQGARDIFEGVAKASSSLGLSVDQTAGALNAIQQMISKGTVSAEELRGQLGERLPGAFQLAARAMGVTTEELWDMLQKGEILAEELLPRLAEELKTLGSEAGEGLQAELNKLGNAWLELQTTFLDSGGTDAAVASVQFLTRFLQDASITIDLYAAKWAYANELIAGAKDPSKMGYFRSPETGSLYRGNISGLFAPAPPEITATGEEPPMQSKPRAGDAARAEAARSAAAKQQARDLRDAARELQQAKKESEEALYEGFFRDMDRNLDVIKDSEEEMRNLRSEAEGFASAITDQIPNLLRGGSEGIKALEAMGQGILTEMANNFLINPLKESIISVLTGTTAQGNDLLSKLTEVFGFASESFGGLFSELLDGMGGLFSGLMDGLGGALGGLLGGGGGGGILSSLIGGVASFIPGGGFLSSLFGFATGGEQLVTKPTLFMAGERGPERLRVSPMAGGLGSRLQGSGGGVTVNIPRDSLVSGITAGSFARKVARAVDEQRRRVV